MNCTVELHSSAAHSPAIDRNVCSFRKPALQTESTRTEASSPRRQCFAATDAISPSRRSCGADIRTAASPPDGKSNCPEVKLPGSCNLRNLREQHSPQRFFRACLQNISCFGSGNPVRIPGRKGKLSRPWRIVILAVRTLETRSTKLLAAASRKNKNGTGNQPAGYLLGQRF